jgi:small subunit ribosomal protein S1
MKNTKQKFIHEIPEEFVSNIDIKKELDFLNLPQVKKGTVVKGRVVNIIGDDVVVDVGLKNESYISLAEFKLVIDSEIPTIGTLVDVYVEKIQDYKGRTILSRKKAIAEESWHLLEKAHEEGKQVDGVIFGSVKGGYTVDLSGVVAFLPGSQVDIKQVSIEPLMGIVQPFVILKMDKKLGNIIVSRRAILEESRVGVREEMLLGITEGMLMEGIVKNITDYGAFVDLGSIDGLLHVTDISWSRINHPSEILSLGQKIKVKVIKFNPETKRISLGMKQLDDSQWKKVNTEYVVGQKLKGKISNITDYGAFIELNHGVEGLVHSSEISWTKINQHPKKLLNIGQEVDFTILEIDTEKHRISLSIKQSAENPWDEFSKNNSIGDIIEAPVRAIAEYGLFVEVNNDIDGFIHTSDISWDGSGTSVFKKGDKIKAKILEIDKEKSRVNLGIKQLAEDPYDSVFTNMTKGGVITCVVSETKSDGITVLVGEKIKSFIAKVDLAADKGDQRPERFAQGDKVDAKIIFLDKNSRKFGLSIKALEVADREKAIKKYGSQDSGASLGDILGASLGDIKTDNSKK